MTRVTFPFDLSQQVPLAHQEEGVLENLIRGALSLGLVKIVHVELPDEGRKVVMFEVLRQNLLPK